MTSAGIQNLTDRARFQLSPNDMRLQSCQRPVTHLDQAVIIPGPHELSSMVGAMAQEWEVAMHNAAIARAAEVQQSLGQQQPQQAIEGPKTAEKPAVEDLHVVEDLVHDIRDKPEGS